VECPHRYDDGQCRRYGTGTERGQALVEISRAGIECLASYDAPPWASVALSTPAAATAGADATDVECGVADRAFGNAVVLEMIMRMVTAPPWLTGFHQDCVKAALTRTVLLRMPLVKMSS